MNFFVAMLALLFDRFIVLPNWVGQRFSHPVVWIGKLIELLEKRLNNIHRSDRIRRAGGIIMLAILIFVTLGVSAFVTQSIRSVPFSWALEALLAAIFLAHHDLHQAVTRVAEALDISLEAARIQVSHIVGRDTNNLDQHEISRAAIESLAENSSDGIIAPLFWLALFGLPGIVVYKAINTADSMVGHMNPRYTQFGWASAKLDDLANWIPARLTAILYGLAARFDQQKNVQNSWETAKRDAPNHLSPNAGWPEAALAGALDFGLGGARAYEGQTLDLATMGDGRRDLIAADIHRALKLSTNMSTIALVLVGFSALTQLILA